MVTDHKDVLETREKQAGPILNLVEQQRKLNAAKVTRIEQLLQERADLTADTEKRIDDIRAELKALGYTRKASPKKRQASTS